MSGATTPGGERRSVSGRSGPVVLLTGASGLVGTWLRRTAPAGVAVVAAVHRTPVDGPPVRSVTGPVDLRDQRAVDAVVERVRPDLVLHAAMAVDEASIVGATANVARAAASVGADVVHLSTDAVFPGDGGPRDEDATPEPVWDYGRWKAEAEAVVAAAGTGSAVVRLPLVVSLDPDDRTVQRIRREARSGRSTGWFTDEVRQPAMAADVATGLWRIAALDPGSRAGVWHLPGPESLSRLDLARRVAAALDLAPDRVGGEATPPDLGRPRHLHLTCERARTGIAWQPSPVLP